MIRFPPSAAPGVHEDAEREGGGAGYVQGPGGGAGAGRPWSGTFGRVSGAGAGMLAHRLTRSGPRSLCILEGLAAI